jgi:hypothetical protein
MAACWGCVGWNVRQRRLISPVNLARDTRPPGSDEQRARCWRRRQDRVLSNRSGRPRGRARSSGEKEDHLSQDTCIESENPPTPARPVSCLAGLGPGRVQVGWIRWLSQRIWSGVWVVMWALRLLLFGVRFELASCETGTVDRARQRYPTHAETNKRRGTPAARAPHARS